MKHTKNSITVLILIFLISATTTFAQSKKKQKNLKYMVWLTTYDGLEHEPGYLMSLQEDFIGFEEVDDTNLKLYHIDNVDLIKYRKESIRGSVFLGMGAGALLGMAIGLSGGDDWLFDSETKAVLGGLYGAGLGAGIGALVGIIKVKVPIHGDRMKYLDGHKKLKKCVWEY